MRFGQRDKTLHPGPPPPAWITSLLLHLALIFALGWVLRQTPQGAALETVRTGGIVLARATEEGDMYEGPEVQSAPESAPEDNPAAALDAALPTIGETGLDPSDALPVSAAVVGPQMLQSGNVPGAGNLTRGGGGQPQSIAGGTTRVKVFGVEGEGAKFVYVFDRSTSMSGARMRAAKSELLASFDSLGPTHQFQIIFFNNQPRIFDLSGGQGRIPFADERTKTLAENFVRGINAEGGTDRYLALAAAIRMRPDVIFFLTDADNPMTPAELDKIRSGNGGGASINTIEFGAGSAPRGENSLQRLARQNRGAYVFVDTRRLQ